MNALVKKEIRLLLPGWSVAMLLALYPACTRPDDVVPVFLLGFGLTILALMMIGRECSLNTFSAMLALPVERIQIWKTKLFVLSAAFVTVFSLWFVAFTFSFCKRATSDLDGVLFNLLTACLLAAATFTGGLWATLLLRQIAGAFWLTLLVPVTLAGFTAGFLSDSQSDNGIIVALCVTFGIYSIGGFFFARWLFYRAQDVGWSGGTLSLPEWKIFSARSETAGSIRNHRPIFALLKKEFRLQQASLAGAVGLLMLHIGAIVLRTSHKFAKDSLGEVLPAIIWLLWLVLPVMVGAMAVAEERRLGVMESQLCLPASRRRQFVIKIFVTMFLGVVLGAVMPMLLEMIAAKCGAINPMFKDWATDGLITFCLVLMASVAGLTLISFFASSLAKNFLQAMGFAITTLVGFMIVIPFFTNDHMAFYSSIAFHSILPLVIGIPTMIVVLLWLAYLNFKNFRGGWPLYRRNLLGLVGAVLFVVVSNAVIYNRTWEVFEPAEPTHGTAKLSLAKPPIMQSSGYGSLLVRLPDGRVWFDSSEKNYYEHGQKPWEMIWQTIFASPFLKSIGPQRFMDGSNWVSVVGQHINTWVQGAKGSLEYNIHVFGYTESVGIQSDGTLWVSDKSDPKVWTANKLTRLGNGTNWQQVSQSWGFSSVLLLKKDGTLWRLGTNYFQWRDWPQKWPGLRAFQPYKIGTNSDWNELGSTGRLLAQKTNESVWQVENFKDQVGLETNYDQIPLQTLSAAFNSEDFGAYIRKDGTLWVFDNYYDRHNHKVFRTFQSGNQTNWISVAITWDMMVALKSDGTLWQWKRKYNESHNGFEASPKRLSIHNDWVAVANTWGGVLSLAADGSLWFWPYREDYEYQYTLLKLPKQPKLLGNVFSKAD